METVAVFNLKWVNWSAKGGIKRKKGLHRLDWFGFGRMMFNLVRGKILLTKLALRS